MVEPRDAAESQRQDSAVRTSTVEEMVSLDGVPSRDGWTQLAVDDAATGDTVGGLALGLSYAGRSAELGWRTNERSRNIGVATEAATALAAWLFDVVGVTRIESRMHPDNRASARVAERVGMVFEGRARNSNWVGDDNTDELIFAMTPDDHAVWIGRGGRVADVHLVEITSENLDDVEKLRTHRSQERFVATVAGSFADAVVVGERDARAVVPWLRAIEADGAIIGFVMCSEPTTQRPDLYLWRLLVDRLHQGRGAGGRTVDLVIEHARSLGANSVHVSWVDGPGSPAGLYLGRGFLPTGEIDDGEVVARLELAAPDPVT